MLPPRYWVPRIVRAVRRARSSIATVASTYLLSVMLGIAMVHAGHPWATSSRDRVAPFVVEPGRPRTEQIGREDVTMALWDAAANATIGSLPKAVSGFAVVLAYPQVAYQGWIGGIVSKARNGPSRFGDVRGAIYYLLTLALQLTGFSLVVGAGVNVGVAALKPRAEYAGKARLGILSPEATRDFGWIYLSSLPFFAVGSTWEFLSPWNLWG